MKNKSKFLTTQNLLIIISAILILNYIYKKINKRKVIELGPERVYKEYYNKKNVEIIDARSKSRYKEFHVKGAVNTPYYLRSKWKNKINSKTHYILYCANYQCNLSQKLADYFYYNGARSIIILRGGVKRWKDNGYPITKLQSKNKMKSIINTQLYFLKNVRKNIEYLLIYHIVDCPNCIEKGEKFIDHLNNAYIFLLSPNKIGNIDKRENSKIIIKSNISYYQDKMKNIQTPVILKFDSTYKVIDAFWPGVSKDSEFEKFIN